MSTRKKRTFSEEFRRDAVSLMEQEGYPLKEASQRLGIRGGRLVKVFWVKGNVVFLRKGEWNAVKPPTSRRLLSDGS